MRFAVRMLAVVMAAAVLVPPVAAGVAVATFLFLPLPASLPAVEQTQSDSTMTTVLAADGSVIGEFRELRSRVAIPPDRIPDVIRRAVVAAEDQDFFRHRGVDLAGMARALWRNVHAHRVEEGGSTITQQLAKNLYTGDERTIGRKLRDAYLAVQMERLKSKNEILAQYLNDVYLGDSTFGVEAASRSYFQKPAEQLTLSEAALLAGLIPAPSRYSPRRHPEEAERKRQAVLDRLLATGLASPETVAAARAERPVVHPPPVAPSRYPYFLDYLRLYLDAKGYSAERLHRGGLRIETTIDPRLQDLGERIVSRLDRPDDPEASLVAVEPSTGQVRALVGGTDWKASQVNLALGRLRGGSGRQAGSAFKPFVLARALDTGIDASRVYPAPASIKPPGFSKPVSNYEDSEYGSADLRTATEKSINTVFAQLVVDAGVRETAAMAQAIGISSIDLSKPVFGGIAVGTQEVSPLDMASAYGVFAARGMRFDPVPVVRITDAAGNVLEDNTEPVAHRVIEEGVADGVTDLLRGVIDRGTGTKAGIGRPAAGKTGTSQNYENAWFCGYTPALSTAVWVGHAEGNVPMHNVHGVPRVAGGTIPAELWHDFMVEALAPVPVTDFGQPAPIEPYADRLRRAERAGIDPGAAGTVADLPPEEPFVFDPAMPVAVAPDQTEAVPVASGPDEDPYVFDDDQPEWAPLEDEEQDDHEDDEDEERDNEDGRHEKRRWRKHRD